MSGSGTGTPVTPIASGGGWHLVTAPTVEPVSLADAKLHLRLDSGTFDGNLIITQSLAYGSHAIANNYTTHVGTGVDVLGKQAGVLLHCGTNGATGTNDTRIEESDQLATGYTAWTGGAFTQVTTTNDNADYKKAYTGSKQYIRTASKVLLAACEFGTSILTNAATSPEDDLLTALIQAARERVEDETRRALLTQTWDYCPQSNRWPSTDFIKIPYGNLQIVTSVKYTDCDGTETTLVEGTDYTVELNGEQHGRIVLPYGESWPTATLSPSNPIVIRFVCGWTTAANVPSRIRTAIKMLVGDLYENRESTVTQQSGNVTVNKAVSALIFNMKLWGEF
ncbi:MAG: head-tail connector protein [Patescibacteria group bacterium]|jgi:uncharacterized phiE125 gp8 family phage protein